MNYLERLRAKGTQEAQEQEFLDRFEEQKLKWEADILETRKRLRKSERELSDLESADELSSADISAKMDEIAGYELGFRRLQTLHEKYFTIKK